MTNPNLTYLAFVIDESGSMWGQEGAVIEGFNATIIKQKEVAGDARVSALKFDNEMRWLFDDKPLHSVPLLNNETYIPRGSTALRDAVGLMIDTLGKRFAAMKEEERPGHVVVVVQTDGYENSSRLVSTEQLKEMITRQREVYSWEFLFLGANQDAVLTGQQFGFLPTHSMTYAVQNTEKTYGLVSNYLVGTRSGMRNSAKGFTLDERSAAVSGE